MPFTRSQLHATIDPDTLLRIISAQFDTSRMVRVPELETMYLANGTAWTGTSALALTDVYEKAILLKCPCSVLVIPNYELGQSEFYRRISVVASKTVNGLVTGSCVLVPPNNVLAADLYVTTINAGSVSISSARNTYYYTSRGDDVSSCLLAKYLQQVYLVPSLSTTVTQASDIYELDDTLIPFKPFSGTYNMPVPAITFDPKEYFV